jgi:nitroreductase
MSADKTPSSVDVLEAIGTARAMRWFRPDPVPDALVEQVVWAATRASSAHNSEPWDIVVVKDERQRTAIGRAIEEAARAKDPLPPAETETDRRIEQGVRNLFAHIGEAPVLILLCGRNCYPQHQPDEKFLWHAVGAASQNMLVAARGLGLGLAPTMLHTLADRPIRAIVDLPDTSVIGVTAALGWPARSFGPLTRRPMSEVVHRDRW